MGSVCFGRAEPMVNANSSESKTAPKRKKMPAVLHGVTPLLFAARTIGLAPYAVDSSNRLRRSKPLGIESAVIVLFQVAIVVYFLFFDALGNVMKQLTIKVFLFGLTLTAEMIFPVYVVVSALTVNFPACRTLFDQISNSEFLPKTRLPWVAKRKWVIVIMTILFTLNVLINSLSYFSYSSGSIETVFYIWKTVLFDVVLHLYCVIVTIMTQAFQDISKKISHVSEQIKNIRPSKVSANSISNSETTCNLETPSFVYKTCNDAVIVCLKSEIEELQFEHSAATEMCDAVEDVFRTYLLIIYASILFFLVEFLFYMIHGLSSHPSGIECNIFLIIELCSWAVVKSVMGAMTAWVAGNAAAAAGEGGAARAVAKLLASARGVPAVEHQAQLFLQQVRASPVQFTAGGLFPLDLRFFVGLLSTILGYLVIVVQFSMPPAPVTCAVMPAENCSCEQDII